MSGISSSLYWHFGILPWYHSRTFPSPRENLDVRSNVHGVFLVNESITEGKQQWTTLITKRKRI
jgi:hypothetical protein